MNCVTRLCVALGWCVFSLGAIAESPAGVSRVAASRDQITIVGGAVGAIRIEERSPFATTRPGVTVAEAKGGGRFTVTIPRFDGDCDRLYSAFAAVGADGRPVGDEHFVDDFAGASVNDEAYPAAVSKKGLQVADVDDALALGIKHGALNVGLGQLIDLAGAPTDIEWKTDGRTFRFRRQAVERLDRQVKALSDRGVLVTLILLNYATGDATTDALMLHPGFDARAPGHISAFNATDERSTEQLKACFEFLAERYSRADRSCGRGVNYIVGNEVDSHWFWYNLGRADLATVAEQYARAVRLCHAAVRKYSATSRVFISLDHFWGMRYSAGTAEQAVAGRDLVERFQRFIADHGDIDWHVAYHPYPENLFEPRFWLDKSARPDADTPRITFKNLEVLPAFLRRPEMLCHGQPRRIILSEQGFHTPKDDDGETIQAAAYAYAYRRVAAIDGIDAFILHRQIDHPNEGGLHLGLWWDAFDNPHGGGRAKKRIYDVFRLADTDQWQQAFEFALPVVGLKSWDEVAR